MNYKDKYKTQIQENLKNVINELETKNLKLKISNWANKFGYSFNEIKEKIINDEVFRCVFAKDPAKQNLYQNLASKYISSLDIVENFKVLPAGGKDAVYLTNGKILKGNLLKNQSKDIKSIDFMWNCKNITFYASHKYTEMNGGAQDNQYKDIQDFLHHSIDCNEKRLQRLTDGKTSFVLNIQELPAFLRGHQKTTINNEKNL